MNKIDITARTPLEFAKASVGLPVFIVTGRDAIAIRAGTQLGEHHWDADTAMTIGTLSVGDYFVEVDSDGVAQVVPAAAGVPQIEGNPVLGGFHFAPGGNAGGRTGGDDVPAINPHSCWDQHYRPDCPDPRGMTCVETPAGKFWCDIYLLGVKPHETGTSRFGVTIADGDDLPADAEGVESDSLDWAAARACFSPFGKSLLSPEEFFAAAYGVTEGASVGKDPETTGLDAPRTSKWGVMQATGNMSIWGVDGDPDGPRLATRFGGSWGDGGFAGSRCADVDYWPGSSYEWVGARGRSDHLQLD